MRGQTHLLTQTLKFPIERNVNLKILFLHENKITEIDEGMKELVNLETLRLGRNKINRIQNLKACVKLSTLDMCHNRLTSTQVCKSIFVDATE